MANRIQGGRVPMLMRWSRIARVHWIVLAALLMGCSRQDPYARYIPDEHAAESALKAGLEAWKDGSAVGPVPATSKPQVIIVDSWRDKQRKLESYQILGEVPGNTPRCYAVRLNLTNPEAEERVRFVVLGIDPLWVYRYEDFQLIAHWDHRMTEEKAAKDAPETAEKPAETATDESESAPE
jgi:hypothetical protein